MALAARLVSDLRMASDNSAIVLLHGILMSGNAWREVVPLLSNHHQVYTPTAAGHRAGRRCSDARPRLAIWLTPRNAIWTSVVLSDRILLVSLGGWMAIELARRGRAATVCALATAGFWSTGDSAQTQVNHQARKFVAMGASPVPCVPLSRSRSSRLPCVGSARVTAACHADRLTAAQSLELLDDIIGCTVKVDDLVGSGEQIAPLNPLPCPVTIAWLENDAVIPVPACDKIARERVPQASFTILPGVGHDPMIDDPDLVARTILASTGAG